MSQSQPAEFARWVVERLSQAGHQALWAGGCVRDMLLGKSPKDYDVATSATPEKVREIFGTRRTIPVGVAFGVITVVGDKTAGNVEVATFRCDGGYSDGRHPDHVTFSNAEQDAQRRDFTINGLFYDPVRAQVIDYVGGQSDLQGGLVRAIGNPVDRFHEDHLRMLRAIRFATVLDFQIEAVTIAAIQDLAPRIVTVSGERVAAEMHRVLNSCHRGRGLELLDQSGLLRHLLPDFDLSRPLARHTFGKTCQRLHQLPVTSHGLEITLSILALDQLLVSQRVGSLIPWEQVLVNFSRQMEQVVRAWKLSNESKSVFRAVTTHLAAVVQASRLPWSRLQPTLIAPNIAAVLAVAEGIAGSGFMAMEDVTLCRHHLTRPIIELNPPPLLTGDELRAGGMPQGPLLGQWLAELRRLQLDAVVTSKAAAWDWVHARAKTTSGKE
ncbi:MAG: CCA tRNA nucleotidyltransferase [Planctomycetaceae bacterium]|nr:CCA tRNA nucleotidyltransferase [Planctomycetaceae bacterium]